MIATATSFSGWGMFVLQCSIDAAASYPDHRCDVLFVISGTKQHPDLLMATNPLLMALLTFLFDLPLSG
jgi:hypothetical protein